MTGRNKGDQLKIYVPMGKKAEITAIAKTKGLSLTDYIKDLIQRDTGLDLTAEMGNPYVKLGRRTKTE